ncbi:hypothetical protein RCZ04_11440 [Capnocytophaga sp. HP1101]
MKSTIIKTLCVVFFIGFVEISFSQTDFESDPRYETAKASIVDYRTFKRNTGSSFYDRNRYNLTMSFSQAYWPDSNLAFPKNIQNRDLREEAREYLKELETATMYVSGGEPNKNTYELFCEMVKYYEVLSKYFKALDANEGERLEALGKFNAEYQAKVSVAVSQKKNEINSQITYLENQIKAIREKKNSDINNIDEEIKELEGFSFLGESIDQYDKKISAIDEELIRQLENNKAKEQAEIKSLGTTNFSANKRKIESKYLSINNDTRKLAQDKKDKLLYEKSLATETMQKRKREQEQQNFNAIKDKENNKESVVAEANAKINEINVKINSLKKFDYNSITPSKPIFDDSAFTSKEKEIRGNLEKEIGDIRVRKGELIRKQKVGGGSSRLDDFLNIFR